MKRTIRIASALGLMAALFMAGHAAPALADEGSPDGAAEVRPPHPCSIAANLRRQWESEKEILDRLEEIKNDAWSDYEEKQDLVDEAEARLEELYDEILALELDIIDEFEDVPGFWLDEDIAIRYHPSIGPHFADRLGGILDHWRNHPGHAHWATTEQENRLEERLNELRSLLEEHHDAEYDLYSAIWDRDAAREEYDEADEKWRDERSDFRSTEASYERAQRECNLTRPLISVTEHPWDSQTQKSMSMFEGSARGQVAKPMSTVDGSFLDQMQNPMGSNANPSSNETQYVIPFGVVEQAQPPQSATGQVAMPEADTPAVTPSRARLFNTPPERHAPGAIEAMPAATGQVMQVDQSGSSNTGTSSFGYTHMPVPQTAGQSGTAVAPQKTLRAIAPIRQMHMHPGRSIKR
jgi:hypothetical protein